VIRVNYPVIWSELLTIFLDLMGNGNPSALKWTVCGLIGEPPVWTLRLRKNELFALTQTLCLTQNRRTLSPRAFSRARFSIRFLGPTSFFSLGSPTRLLRSSSVGSRLFQMTGTRTHRFCSRSH